ncbi:hypothetical protein Hanom_Chr01g00067571 [Helianthus anomalus]
MFYHPYNFMIHCVVHGLSHRIGAYNETSDYIMNIITSLVLNRPYNVSKVIFEYMEENAKAGSTKYIMYPRFIQMLIDGQFKDIQKSYDDILSLSNMTPETISRLTKGPEPRGKRMICKINNPAYVALENDMWRHENSNSENEDEEINQMDEKKPRWWFVKDGKRKRTPKTSPVVPIPKEPSPKIVVKGPSKEPQQRLVDEIVLDPSSTPQEGVDLAKVTFEQYIQHTAAASQKDQTSSAQGESVKEKEPEGVARVDSSEVDSESTETEKELDLSTLGGGKAQLKKKPSKRKKTSDEEDNTYTPSVDEQKKLRIKQKAVQSGDLPRRVRARKGGASLPKDQGGKKEKHVTTSKVHEAEKVQSVEVPKAPEVQVQSVSEVEIQKKGGNDDYVEITSNQSFREEVGELEKEKTKAEAERDMLKKQVEELKKVNEEIKTIMINQAKKLKKLKDDVHDNSQLFELLSADNVEMRVRMKKLEEINEMLKGTSSKEMKVMKLEMEAMKAD